MQTYIVDKVNIEELESTLCANLNPEQKSAVKREIDEYTSVIAGAGTGKTTIISAKYVDLIAKLYNMGHKKPLENILVITFTEKAAANMKTKIFEKLKADNIPYSGQDNYISTIHSFCSKILRAHAIDAGLTQYFTIETSDVLNQIYNTIIEKIKQNEIEQIPFICKAAEKLGVSLEVLNHENILNLMPVGNMDDILDGILTIINQVKSLGLDAEEFLLQTKSAITTCADVLKNIPVGEVCYDDFSKKWSYYLFNNGLATIKDSIYADDFDKYFSKHQIFNKIVNGKTLNKRNCEDWQLSEGELENISKTTELELIITDIVALIYETYQMQLLNADTIGFDDVINLALHVLDNEVIRHEYQEQFEHIIVDEFQDTSVAQMKLIQKLMKPETPDVTIVGDRKQSIYGFRYANMENVSDLTNAIMANPVYQNKVKEINLRTNYRSTQSVIDVVNDVTLNFLGREDEVLETPKEAIPSSIKMTHFPEKSMAEIRVDEAKQIAIEISNFKAKHDNFDFSKFAVLVRKATEADVVEEQLTNCGIPCIKSESTSFFHKKVIKNAKALLKIALNVTDEHALLRLLVSKFSDRDIYLLKKEVEKSLDLENNPNDKYLNFAEKLYKSRNKQSLLLLENVNKDLLSSVEKIFENAEFISKNIKTLSIHSIYLKMLEAFDVAENYDGVEKTIAARDLIIFEKIILDYMNTEIYTSIKNFLEYLDTLLDDKKFVLPSVTTDTIDAVNIMTIHASKGLEFPYVFVFAPDKRRHSDMRCFNFELGTNNGKFGIIVKKFNGQKTLKSLIYEHCYKHIKDDMEAVRLFYVAVSRAQEYLNIFCLPDKKAPADYVKNLSIAEENKIEIADEMLKEIPQFLLPDYDYKRTIQHSNETKSLPQLELTSLSFSKINIFNHCQKRFLLQYIYGYPQVTNFEPSGGILAGSIVHDLICFSFANKKQLSVKEIKDLWQNKIKDEDFEKVIVLYFAFSKTKYADYKNDKFYSEYGFSFKYRDIDFNGDIDLLILNPDKTYTIVDFKTNKDIEKSLSEYTKQLFIYKSAMEQSGLKISEVIILNLLPDGCKEYFMNDELKKAQIDLDNDIDNIIKLYNNEIEELKISTNCYACGYNYICNAIQEEPPI